MMFKTEVNYVLEQFKFSKQIKLFDVTSDIDMKCYIEDWHAYCFVLEEE
jgi:hypothetical protein